MESRHRTMIEQKGFDKIMKENKHVDLSDQTLCKVHISDPEGKIVGLSNTSLYDCVMENVQNSDLDCHGTSWTEVELRNNVKLEKSDFTEATFTHCRTGKGNDVSFRDSNFSGSRFRQGNLRGVDFANADFYKSTFNGVIISESRQEPPVKNLDTAIITQGGATSLEVDKYRLDLLGQFEGKGKSSEREETQKSALMRCMEKTAGRAPKSNVMAMER